MGESRHCQLAAKKGAAREFYECCRFTLAVSANYLQAVVVPDTIS
jgi:hypothetical protein